MNILIDIVPDAVVIDSNEYEINSDFRTSILFELLMQDSNLSDKEKIINALKLYYPIIPNNVNEAIEQVMWFYRGGKDVIISNKKCNGKSFNKVYSFEHDDDYIYSAFLDQYGLDLQDIEYLHWWKFKAMFKALKEENEIVKIMGYRSMDINSIKDKEQKAHYKKMKDIYKIPNNLDKSEQQKISDIENALLNGGDINKIL